MTRLVVDDRPKSIRRGDSPGADVHGRITMNPVSRLVVTGLSAAALAATPVAAVAAPAVPTTPTTASKPIDCDPDSEFYLAGGGGHDVLTHRYGFHMVAHQTKTITQRAKRVKVLKTDVDISGDAKLSGNKITKILLTAEASLHGHFAKMSETTEENEITVTDQIRTNKKEGNYVAFAGYRYFTGWWKLMHCEGDGVTKRLIESGSFEAFDPVHKDGFALCPSSRYKFGTLMAEACAQAWE
jgi:hypothetical protein